MLLIKHRIIKIVTDDQVNMGMTPRQLSRYSSSQEHLKLQKNKKGQMKKVNLI